MTTEQPISYQFKKPLRMISRVATAVLTVLACTTMNGWTAPLVEMASTDFNYQYNASAGLLPEASTPAWTVASAGLGSANLSGGALNLSVPNDGSYYEWQLSPANWAPPVSSLETGFTVEWSINLAPGTAIGLNLAFAGEAGAGYGLLYITADNTQWSVGTGRLDVVDSNSNESGYHVFRLIKLPSIGGDVGAFTLYRDGELVFSDQAGEYDAYGAPSNRFYFGALGQAGVTNAQIEYVRWDTTGAFSPIPEPGTLALFGIAVGIGLCRQLRKSSPRHA